MSEYPKVDDSLRQYCLGVFEKRKCALSEAQLNRVQFVSGNLRGRKVADVVGIKSPVTLVTDVRYIFVVDVDRWEKLSDTAKEAYAHHNMLHIPVDEGKFNEGSMAKHDLRDFREIVDAHGTLYQVGTK